MNILRNPHLQNSMHRKKNLIETPKIRSKIFFTFFQNYIFFLFKNRFFSQNFAKIDQKFGFLNSATRILRNPHLQNFMHRKKNLIETPKIRSKIFFTKIKNYIFFLSCKFFIFEHKKNVIFDFCKKNLRTNFRSFD